LLLFLRLLLLFLDNNILDLDCLALGFSSSSKKHSQSKKLAKKNILSTPGNLMDSMLIGFLELGAVTARSSGKFIVLYKRRKFKAFSTRGIRSKDVHSCSTHQSSLIDIGSLLVFTDGVLRHPSEMLCNMYVITFCWMGFLLHRCNSTALLHMFKFAARRAPAPSA